MPEDERRAREQSAVRKLEKAGGQGLAVDRGPRVEKSEPVAEGAPGTEAPKGPRPRETQ